MITKNNAILKNEQLNFDNLKTSIDLQNYTNEVIDNIKRSNVDAFSSIKEKEFFLNNKTYFEEKYSLPLRGMCFGVKEVIDVKELVCNLGCEAFSGRKPKKNADIVSLLEELGGQVIGITRSTELAIAKETSTVNPWSIEHTPGGSSSGSASAVGAGLIPFALGTQTIGSIIRPAAYCGAVGFKPTKGIGSLSGIVKLSDTLDHLGYFSDSVERMITTLNVLYPEVFENAYENNLIKPRILCVQPWFTMEDNSTWKNSLEKVKKYAGLSEIECLDVVLDKEITDVEDDITDSILCFEMFDEWGDILYEKEGTSDFLQSFLRRGKKISYSKYRDALSYRNKIDRFFESLMMENDVIVFPSVTGLPPKLGAGTGSRDTQRLWTLLGMPALNLPVGIEDGFPKNIQLISKKGQDGFLLDFAIKLRNALLYSGKITVEAI